MPRRTDSGVAERVVAVVGGGSIGVGWAVVFARAQVETRLYEPDRERRAEAPVDLERRLRRLAAGGLLDDDPGVVAARVCCTGTLEEAVAGAAYVQECAPESLELKRGLFRDLDLLAAPETMLASSSSAITAGAFASGLRGRSRCLVAHPGNPPYLLPVVELVPAEFTDAGVVERARAFLGAVGMSPLLVRREVEGFVFNRLQGALLREAYCLVRDGVASVDDVDRVVRDGLGRRWSVMGPFETAELNTRGGIAVHAATLGPAYARMGAERGQDDPWTPDLVGLVAEELHRRVPPERREERIAWRDDALIALERARRASGLFDDSRHSTTAYEGVT
jgi:3-hydroxyacyl-CoA dehydrogenase